jgi:citrate synthase
MADVAKLTIEGNEYELPVMIGSEGERSVDISKLRNMSGVITLDHGFGNTGATDSEITFLDGEEGILRYRGYPIESLAEHCDFIEVCYLLIYGELPIRSQLEEFRNSITRSTLLHEDVRLFLDGFPRDAHPMGVMSSVVNAMSAFYKDSLDPRDDKQVHECIRRLIGKFPTLAAYVYKKSIGKPLIYPQNRLSYCENFLNMMFALPSEDYVIDPDFAKALNLLLIVHADHEQNCSTSTVRMIGSADANLFASIAGGIGALWGPLHGGANEAVVNMLRRIRADGGNVKKYVDMAKDKDDGFRLMGFGHRVYKNFDPRSKIIKEACNKLLSKRHINDELFDIALELQEVALNDPYFIERKLYPNVDFYSGVIYRAIGIPTPFYPVLFAIGRLPGWIAHWLEMRQSQNKRIARPRQVYNGPTQREFVPLQNRG